MDKNRTLVGKIVSGVRQAAYFTQLDWVREQCREKLGFEPWPGTLNVEFSEDFLPLIEALREEEGVMLIPPDPRFCAAKVRPCSMGDISAAIVLPAEDVNVHGKRVIEIIAPLRLKDALGLDDGDSLELALKRPIPRGRENRAGPSGEE
jgi:CTP-dependent riboflavin kinase